MQRAGLSSEYISKKTLVFPVLRDGYFDYWSQFPLTRVYFVDATMSAEKVLGQVRSILEGIISEVRYGCPSPELTLPDQNNMGDMEARSHKRRRLSGVKLYQPKTYDTSTAFSESCAHI